MKKSLFFFILISFPVASRLARPRFPNPTTPNQIWMNDLDLYDGIVRNRLAIHNLHLVNIMDGPFNAQCDAVTNDTLAIQSAITYAENISTAGWSTVVIPPSSRNCKIMDQLNITKSIRFVGFGGVLGGADSDYTTDAGAGSVSRRPAGHD